MRLSRFTDYSLRTLFLVCANSDRRVTLHEISEFYGISLDHLRKVVNHLAQQGFIETFRGKQGGMCLAQPAENIRLGDVIRSTEGNGALIDCSGGCHIAPVCQLTGVLNDAHSAFYSVLDRYSLSDLANSSDFLQALTVEIS